MKTLKRLARMMPLIFGVILFGFCVGSPIEHCARVGGIIAAMTIIFGVFADFFEGVQS